MSWSLSRYYVITIFSCRYHDLLHQISAASKICAKIQNIFYIQIINRKKYFNQNHPLISALFHPHFGRIANRFGQNDHLILPKSYPRCG